LVPVSVAILRDADRVTPTPDPNRIVVGVDGSASSIDALRYAATLATALTSPLQVVTTWVAPAAGSYYSRGEWPPEADAESQQKEAISAAFGESPPSDMTATVVPGPAARTLIDLSADARMLVLGSRGHGGFAGLLLGSVSATCAEHARCPVLVVH
jgi:nucleotide-binding universal stress UspA family protein